MSITILGVPSGFYTGNIEVGGTYTISGFGDYGGLIFVVSRGYNMAALFWIGRYEILDAVKLAEQSLSVTIRRTTNGGKPILTNNTNATQDFLIKIFPAKML